MNSVKIKKHINKFSSKTPQDIDGQDWGESEYTSHVVTNSRRLRRVPLADFNVEDLRFAIGQESIVDNKILLPFALDLLEADPWVSGDYYEGDLLSNVLSLDYKILEANADFYIRLIELVAKAKELGTNKRDEYGRSLLDLAPKELRKLIENF